MKKAIFSEEFVNEVYNKVVEHCSEGDAITAPKLAAEVGLEETDHLLLSQLRERHLSDRVGVRMGPNGGFVLVDVPARKKDKPTKGPKVDPDFAVRATETLNQLFAEDPACGGITTSYLTAKMGLGPQEGVRSIAEAAKAGLLTGYTIKRGAGIVPVRDEAAVNNASE